MEILKGVLLVFALLLGVGSCGNLSGDADGRGKGASADLPLPAADFTGAETFNSLVEEESPIWKGAFFYGYVPSINSIGKYDLKERRIEKWIDCRSFCGSALRAITLPPHSDTLLVFKAGIPKAIDLHSDQFYDLPGLTIENADFYFTASQVELFGFLDRNLQKVNLFDSGQKVIAFDTGIEGANIVRSSPGGDLLFLVNTKNLEMAIFRKTVTIEPDKVVTGYEQRYSGNLSTLTSVAGKDLGNVVDAAFTANKEQLLLITNSGYLINLTFNNGIPLLRETFTSPYHLARINPDSTGTEFFLTYWGQGFGDPYGLWRFSLNSDMTLKEGDRSDFGSSSTGEEDCRRPIQIHTMSTTERLYFCFNTGWFFQSDSNPWATGFVSDLYMGGLNRSGVLYPAGKEVVTLENSIWGRVRSYSFPSKEEGLREDFLLEDFFQ